MRCKYVLNKITKNTDLTIQTQKFIKKNRKQIPLLEYESAKLHKYNLKKRNEIQRQDLQQPPQYTNLIIISLSKSRCLKPDLSPEVSLARFLTAKTVESPSLALQGIDDFPTLSSSRSSTGSAMSRPWVGAASLRAASTPSSLRSTTSSIGSTALSPTTNLRLFLFPPQLSPPPTSLATRSRTSSGSCSAESSNPFSSLPNSLTLRSPYDVIPGFFASAPPLLGGLIWREILCFALWLLDWIWVLFF